MIIEYVDTESTFFRGTYVDAALATENGRKHTQNEDRYVFLPPGNRMAEALRQGYLFGVMDGCGGFTGAAEASQMVADRLRTLLKEASDTGEGGRTIDRAALMERALREANEQVGLRQLAEQRVENMACAVTVVWLWEEAPGPDGSCGVQRDRPDAGEPEEGGGEADDEPGAAILRCHLVHVGDTRAYLVRDGEVRRLTSDHKGGRVLTAVVGMAPERFEFLSRAVAARRGDILLVATDGLWKPHEISLAELVDSCGRHPLHLVQDWLTITRRNGSDDDQTAIAVVVG